MVCWVCVGFVVNVYDPLNLDIDLLIPDSKRHRFRDVFYNKYSYVDEDGEEQEGITYRCRLRGVSYDVKSQSLRRMIRKDSVILRSYVEMNQMIDRCNGWVLCHIYEIDAYQRIILDIFDPISKKNIGSNLLSTENQGKFRHYIQNQEKTNESSD